jgi:hypothetical protein
VAHVPAQQLPGVDVGGHDERVEPPLPCLRRETGEARREHGGEPGSVAGAAAVEGRPQRRVARFLREEADDEVTGELVVGDQGGEGPAPPRPGGTSRRAAISWPSCSAAAAIRPVLAAETADDGLHRDAASRATASRVMSSSQPSRARARKASTTRRPVAAAASARAAGGKGGAGAAAGAAADFMLVSLTLNIGGCKAPGITPACGAPRRASGAHADTARPSGRG